MLYLSSLAEVATFSRASGPNMEIRTINAFLTSFEVLLLLVIVKTDEKTFFKVFKRQNKR